MIKRRTFMKAAAATAALGTLGVGNAMSEQNIGKIDVHQHFLPDVYVSALAKLGIHGAGGVDFPKWTPDGAMKMMDGQNIKTGILSISAPGVHFGDDGAAVDLARTCNEYSASLVKQNPDRFGVFAVLPMPLVDESLTEIEFALDQLKLDGVVLLSSYSDGTYLGDPKFDTLMAALDARSAVAFVHPTVPVSAPGEQLTIPPFATEFVFDTSRAIANLIWTGVAEKYPNIKFIFSHAGGTAPFLAWRWSLLEQLPVTKTNFPKGFLHYLQNFYYDTALSCGEQALGALTKLVSSDKILFGSDFPFAPPPISVAAWAGVTKFDGLSPADRGKIASDNATQLFPRLA